MIRMCLLSPSPLPFLLRKGAHVARSNCATVKPVLGFALLAFPPSRSPSTAFALRAPRWGEEMCAARVSPSRGGRG